MALCTRNRAIRTSFSFFVCKVLYNLLSLLSYTIYFMLRSFEFIFWIMLLLTFVILKLEANF